MQVQFYIVLPLVMTALAWSPRPIVGQNAEHMLQRLRYRTAIAALIGLAVATAYRIKNALSFELPLPVFGPLHGERPP